MIVPPGHVQVRLGARQATAAAHLIGGLPEPIRSVAPGDPMPVSFARRIAEAASSANRDPRGRSRKSTVARVATKFSDAVWHHLSHPAFVGRCLEGHHDTVLPAWSVGERLVGEPPARGLDRCVLYPQPEWWGRTRYTRWVSLSEHLFNSVDFDLLESLAPDGK